MPDEPPTNDPHAGDGQEDAQAQPPAPEPDVDGADWLLDQLSGGRRARREAELRAAEEERAAQPEAQPTGEQGSAPADAEPEPEAAAEQAPAAVPDAEPAQSSIPDDRAAGSWSLLTDDTAAFEKISGAVDAPTPAPVAPDLPEPEPAQPDLTASEPAQPDLTASEPVIAAAVPAWTPPVWAPAPTPPTVSDADAGAGAGADDDLPTDEDDGIDDTVVPAFDDTLPPAFVWGLRPGVDPSQLAEEPGAAAGPIPDAAVPIAEVPAAVAAEAASEPVPEPPAETEPSSATEVGNEQDAVADADAVTGATAPVFGAPVAAPPAFPPPAVAPVPDEPDIDDDLAHWFAPLRTDEPATAPIAAAAADAGTDAETEAAEVPTELLPASLETNPWIDTVGAAPAVSGFDFPPVETAALAGAAAGAASATGAAAPVKDEPTETAAPIEHGGSGPRAPLSKQTRILLWIAAGLALLVVLLGLFWLGTRLPGMLGSAPATPTKTVTATPTVPVLTGPAAAGEHAWNELFGGECIDPFTDPWAETFTVVDCAAPHASQLVYRGTFGGDATTPFPGENALAGQINALCSAPGVIDLAAAGAFPNLQLQGTYPVTEEQWTTTERNYYCFATRSTGEPITGSIAGPGPAPTG